MTKRTPLSALQNIWFDAQQVDDIDLTLEQDYNSIIDSSIINNHIGTGILSEVLTQNILFDSILSTGFLDGVVVQTQNQPTDNNLGNQLEIELTESIAAGNKSVKICIIGLDFQSNLQYETFYFKTNEIQVSKKHFTRILTLLFNDFIGNPSLSFNLGGRLIIKEASPLTLSRSPIMVSQDIEPNLFFRDFFVDGFVSLQALLQSALPLYNIDTLNIFTSAADTKVLLKNDVTTQIGQKFIAATNNIQKITTLLSVRNLDIPADLIWNGDLLISIYPLQSDISCPSDIAPNLAIDFAPSNIPVAQLNVSYASLQAAGIILDSVPQPIDFVFSNSSVATGNILIPTNYYAFTIKRAGSANKCDILISVGNDRTTNSRITTFTGSLWVDIPEQDLWFQIWTDAAKVSDGQAYDSGHGVTINKTVQDPLSLATVDFSFENLPFFGNDVFRAVVSADTFESVPIPDQRTGNPVLSRKQFIPNIQLFDTIDITNLEKASEPLIIGAISDKNRKFFDSLSSVINSKLYSATMVKDELIIKIVDDPTDVVRFDTSVSGLITNLLNGDFASAKITPNTNNPTLFYRISSAKLDSMILGDVNGDGIIDNLDLDLLNHYIDYDLVSGLPTNTSVITDGTTTTFTNGYNTYTVPFSNQFGISFQMVDPITHAVVASGNDGVLVANPADSTLAQFTSASVVFNTIIGISSFKLVLLTPLVQADYGAFDIISIDTLADVLTIRKIFLTGDVIAQMLRADIDGDFHITTNDGYLLQSYIERVPLTSSPTSSFPGPSTNSFVKIGTRFNVIRFKLEQFSDRTDDYSSVTLTRSTVVHPAPDIFLADATLASHNFYTSPIIISFQKQLTWDSYLMVTNSISRLVPSVFTTLDGFVDPSCLVEGINVSIYGAKPDFNPGTVDFFVPNNLIIGNGGEVHNTDGSFYKVDFEVGTIVLEIPSSSVTERTLNIVDDFISDYTGDGRTRLGFPAMKFADCTPVNSDALSKDQVRFSVAVQSFSQKPVIATTDGDIGVFIDHLTGLLTLTFSNLNKDAVLSTESTKIQIHVFLKKGGFNNKTIFVDANKVQNMLKLISVFPSSAGPSALIDLGADVSGILPIIHGGTGLNDVGAFGTVLVSNGSSLSYQFVADAIAIPFSSGISDADKIPKTDGYGLLDPSFMYKNPIYIYGTAGFFTTDGVMSPVVGGFTFRFDKYILEGLESIKLEAVMATSNALNTAELSLTNITTSTSIPLVGASLVLSTTSTTGALLTSDDLKNSLSVGATDFIYVLNLDLNPANVARTATCIMARLVITYSNPETTGLPLAHSSNFVPYLPSPTPS